MNRLECLAMALSEDGKFRPITIFLYLNELADNCGVSRACDCMCDIMDPRLVDTFFPHLGFSFVPRTGATWDHVGANDGHWQRGFLVIFDTFSILFLC